MSALQRALEALQRGNPLSGERIVTDAVKIAAQAYGAQSGRACQAHFEASQFFHAAGKPTEMLMSLQAAARVVPQNEEEQAARFGYLFQLGAALDRQGQLSAAEQVLRALVSELSETYGELGQAVATGNTALAGVLYEQGEIEEALALVDGAVQTLASLGDAGVAPALALRAFVVKAYSPVEPSFPEEMELPPELVETLAEAALERVPQSAPPLALLALSDIEALVCESLGDTHRLRGALLAQTVRTAAEAGDDDAQMRALGVLDKLAKGAGDLLGQADIQIALGEAHAAQGRKAEAIAAFERAAEFAAKGPRVLALGLARHAQYRAAIGDDAESRELMERSVEATRDSKEQELIGSCLTTQGVLLQHAGDDEAAGKLEAALDLLTLGHPDADIATEHLEALEEGRPCGCFGDTALLQAVATALEARLPAGLLRSVAQDQDGFRVDLAREPSAEEHQLVERALNEVLQEVTAAAEDASGS
ncbi:MAG: hypothetical protein KC492_36495 [Myxococcales bacterium]|nr:hypothetical protein [Myxococcales bacterium]